MYINDLQRRFLNLCKDIEIENQLQHHNYINAAQRARNWIEKNTIRHAGIVITSKQRRIYQEVTGYYIPTLLQWGMRDLAIDYAKYLCNVQQDSGAWLSFDYKYESIFNTGQVLRGLVSILDIMPEVRNNLERGCEWLLSYMQEDGRLASTQETVWLDNGINTELIHLYCLPPLVEAGKKLNKAYYIQCANRILEYYIREYHEDIINFNYLSHFYAYVLEALCDMGKKDLVKQAMKKIEKIQRFDGAIPAYRDCEWVCSTGLFQLAIVWFKLGQWKQGNKTFDYAVSLQNKSGGWYGSYPAIIHFWKKKIVPYYQFDELNYFAKEEISWAVKYFFDALYYRQKLDFERRANTFQNSFKIIGDEKYKVVYECVKKMQEENMKLDILDVGCGKGRYLKKLFLQLPQNKYYGVDISEKVLSYVKNNNIILKKSSILKIEYENEQFDIVYAAESIEHAILIEEAIKEMARVLKKDGLLVIIDKDAKAFDNVKYFDWLEPEELRTKQWLEKDECIKLMYKSGLTEIESFYIDADEKNMYRVFIGKKRR